MESLEIMPVRIRITAILRKAIYSGEYKSGEELSLTRIAAQLGVSRTPVREAFQALAAEGLITLRMNKGAVVNPIDEPFIRDIFEMRTLLESEAAARAAVRGMPSASILLKRLEGMEEDWRLGRADRGEYEALNQEIHMEIWNAAGSRKLKSFLMELWNGPSAGPSPRDEARHFQNSTAEHLRILKAIEDGKADAARAAMSGHIERSMENILKIYGASGE